MKQRLHVAMLDGDELDVVAAAPDFIRWEKQYKRKTSSLAGEWATEDWAFLAWAALKRQRSTADTFDDWLGGVLEVMPSDQEPVRPTPPAASTEGS
jgi:hypothetical protein